MGKRVLKKVFSIRLSKDEIFQQSKIMNTQVQIPPILPLQKGGIPLFEKEGVGEILERLGRLIPSQDLDTRK
jgi:hypothetical protein